MSRTAQRIKTRYERGWVTDEQLSRYLELGAITHEEYTEIRAARHTEEEEITV